MQALLSYADSPPIAAPFRFFLTAPLFGVLAGLLLLWSGPVAFASRWMPETLALTHLITAGFMLQVMLGALIQVLPVVAGANIERPLLIARLVHAAMSLGTLLLSAAFMTFMPGLFIVSSLCFILGGLLFIVSSARAVRGLPATGPTLGGLKIALSGLGVTVALGIAMALGLAGWFNLPLMQLADLHLGWGFLVWGVGLLAAVAYVVVPMFQITPAYPAWLARRLVPFFIVATSFWTVSMISEIESATLAAALGMTSAAALFAGATLILQRRSRRPRFDTSQHCWRVAMLCILMAGGVWLAAMLVPVVDEWPGWPLLCGVFLMFGGFVSVITGMLYKIVPFLVWLHLQNLGKGVLTAPNMKKIIDEKSMRRQMLAHFAAGVMLLLAVFAPEWFARPAGMLVALSQAWLAVNLWSAVKLFREQHGRIVMKRGNDDLSCVA